jgi:hypothetical protein
MGDYINGDYVLFIQIIAGLWQVKRKGNKMKNTQYIVILKSGIKITVWAFNKKAAKILGMAEAIKRGLDYSVAGVQEVEE